MCGGQYSRCSGRGITEIRAAAAEEAFGCLSPTGCGRNDQAKHESEQGLNVSYRREAMCLLPLTG
jgi:hypothetical protein